MKKLYKTTLLAFVLALMAIPSLQAQQRFAIKINPLSLFVLTGNVQGEMAINQKMSAQLGLFYTGLSTGYGTDDGSQKIGYRIFGITPEFRLYFANRREAMRGVYVAPFLRYRQVNVDAHASVYDPDTQEYTDANVNLTTAAIGGGATLGYQLITRGGFTFDIYGGPQYSSAALKMKAECVGCDGDETLNEQVGIRFGGFGFRAGLALGYAF